MKATVSVISLALFLAATAAIAQVENPQVKRIPTPIVKRNLPDITNQKRGITIGGAVGGSGGKFIAWGSTGDLSALEPLAGTIVNGRCAFNVSYDQINIGTAPTSPEYINRLKIDGSQVVSINSAEHLNAGESKQVDTQAYFNEGSHSLTLSLDDGNAVVESNEGNNAFSIKYTLKCSSKNTTKEPDITNEKRGIIIGGAVGGAGGQFVPWGGSADLSALDPLAGTAVNGKCAFNVTYDQSNIGTAATSPDYINRLKIDGSDIVAINSAEHLNAGETKQVTTQPYLTQGSHSLTLSLDDGNAVPESNEANNTFSIKYTLKCKGEK